MRPEFTLLLMVVTGLVALARATRLVVDDAYPPMERIRAWYVNRTSEAWNPLVECPWCAAPYLAVPAVAWFAITYHFTDWTVNTWIWWLVNGWAAASWLAAYLTLRDIPPESRE